jgi:hypothetical protein
MTVNGSQFTTTNFLVPAGGTTHAVGFNGGFSSVPYPIDWRQFKIDAFPFQPQGVYIDNSAGTVACNVTVQPIGWTISCPAGQRLSTSFPAPNGQTSTITGDPANSVNVVFVDYPVFDSSEAGNGSSVIVSNTSPIGVTLNGAPGIPTLPSTATFASASSGNEANATAVATLAGAIGKTTFCSGFEITAGGATASSIVLATLSGILGGSQIYAFAVPAGATLGATPLVVEFNPPLPSSAANTAIAITLPALGAGNTNAVVNIHGYKA